ncbi:hypothetical protein CPB83DRAFT_909222 [Crepidotus variabilis]|uniref:Uncharacterized protein n=1 Tax=Crepidotus variabilis TaxID=179855 RepID=A0A9P6EA82_9AGAR|nr:hypothetical protein CPB83DRAFT_909222 [Crepidotus variabilis]
MGFLKRLFSSKKNKSKHQPIHHEVPLPEEPALEVTEAMNEEEHEATVGRLLRSRSARYLDNSSATELPYALPPIPHPINQVIQTPASSCVSLASTSISQRGTYTVTVHGRKRHASTEFPLANSELGEKRKPELAPRSTLAPVEDSRVLRLRSDPSVASLLELYDEHGQLADDAFTDTESSPPKQGRAQVKRNGSTLRQLLGGFGNDNSEGDISWADRFLAESEATSINSSCGLRTPDNDHFHGEFTKPEISFMSDADVTTVTFDNPAISSMEVEINDSYNVSQDFSTKLKDNSPYIHTNPATPQRASQIFGFLTKGKQSKPPTDLDRTLPEPPSTFSSPSEENSSGSTQKRLSFADNSADISFRPSRFSAPPRPTSDAASQYQSHPRISFVENTPRPGSRRLSQGPHSAFSDDSHDIHGIHINAPFPAKQPPQPTGDVEIDSKQNDIRVLMTGPTKVILTAPTPGTHHTGPSRLPRGPRAPSRKTSSGSMKRRRSVLGEVSSNAYSSASHSQPGNFAGASSSMAGDPFIIVTPKKVQRRNSNSSVRSVSRKEYEEKGDQYISGPQALMKRPVSPAHVNRRDSSYGRDRDYKSKENQLGHGLSLSVKNELPSTPLRSNTGSNHHAGGGSRNLFKTMVNQGMFKPTPAMPDPNLSSEMSTLGKQMMSDVRQQRLRAREAERARLNGGRF